MSPEQARAKLKQAKRRLRLWTQVCSWLGVALLLAAIWSWPHGVGGRLLLTAGVSFAVSFVAAAGGVHVDTLLGEVRKVQRQRAGDGSVSVQAGGSVNVYGQRPAPGRGEIVPMTARPKAPRNR